MYCGVKMGSHWGHMVHRVLSHKEQELGAETGTGCVLDSRRG